MPGLLLQRTEILKKKCKKAISVKICFTVFMSYRSCCPPWKERKADIPYLISHFIEQFADKKDASRAKFSDDALNILTNYSWPGNVRELKNLIERLVVLHESDEILPEELPEKIRAKSSREAQGKDVSGGGISFNTAVSEFEKALIISALDKTNWVKNRAAQLLKIKRTTLVEKIKRYNLEKDSD
jgi:DNA-binding NtrC family response regulator